MNCTQSKFKCMPEVIKQLGSVGLPQQKLLYAWSLLRDEYVQTCSKDKPALKQEFNLHWKALKEVIGGSFLLDEYERAHVWVLISRLDALNPTQ